MEKTDHAMASNAFWEKIDDFVKNREFVIDRSKGSAHPRFPACVYPLDYGYLAGTASSDGEEIDVWKGSGEPWTDALICTVDSLKNDVEIKLLLGCTEEEKQQVLAFHNASDNMKGLLVRR